MRTCTKCNEILPFSEFYKHSKRKDGTYILRPICKPCNLIRNKAYFKANPHVKKDYVKRLIKTKREFVKNLKENTPCLDCKKPYPFWIMDFDHVRGNKINKVSRLVYNATGMKALKAEIAKCELVCSNCHRTRTYLRKDYIPKLSKNQHRDSEEHT